jgi:large subunit ribosomal protein L14e
LEKVDSLPAFEIGRLCIKTTGRDAGKRCVIIDIIDKNFALITGPKQLTGVRRRRVNMNHLKPLEEKIEITKGIGDEQVIDLLK